MRASITLATALLAAATAVPAAAQEADDFRWSGTVAAGRTVTILGLNGNVEATPAAGGAVEVIAEKRARRSDPEGVRIEVRETAEGVTICPVYPGRSGCPGEESGPRGRRNDRNDVRVDFIVRVPAGVHLDASTVNGAVEARSLTGDVRAASVNGKIRVDAAGTVRASTVNGSIEATSGSARWTGELDFRTVNGSIDLALPAGASAAVEAMTVNGGLSTDFPLTIPAGRQWGPRKMEGTIGQGGGTLRLETVNGAIRLRRR